MRLVYHHRTAGRGGEGNHILGVVHALEQAGHDVLIVSPPGVDPRRAIGDAPLDKSDRREVGLSRLWKWVSCRFPQILFEVAELGYNPWAVVQVGRAIQRRRDAVLYERYALFMFGGVFVGRLLSRRIVLEVNEVVGVRRARDLVLWALSRRIERYVFRHASEIVTVSSYLQREILARGGRSGHVHVIPNAIDPARFEAPRTSREVRGQLGLTGKLVVGFVGWFDKWDRLDLLIELCRELRPVLPDLRLLLVGDGPVADELRHLTMRYGLHDVVTITGAIPCVNVPSYIEAIDICVLPDSNAFGSPLVLFEFMALRRAIVAADVPPVREVVQHGVNGLLVRCGDLQHMIEAVSLLARDSMRRQMLGATARRIVFERHTWTATAARIAELAGGTSPGQRQGAA